MKRNNLAFVIRFVAPFLLSSFPVGLAAMQQIDPLSKDLIAAAQQGNTRDVKVALFDGADSNRRDSYRQTALMYGSGSRLLTVR